MMAISAEQLEAYFGRSLEKGRRYLEEDRVEVEQFDDHGAMATVRGSHGARWYTQLMVDPHPRHPSFETDCNCPVGMHCKHGAALALFWVDAQEMLREPATRAPAAAKPQRSAAPAAAAAASAPLPDSVRERSPWGLWLRDRAAPRRTPGAPERIVVYLLEANTSGMYVQPVRCSQLKSGGYGRPSPLDLASERFLSQVRDWPVEDRTLLLSLDPYSTSSMPGARGLSYEVPDGDPALVTALLATGRLRWEHVGGPVLALGPERPLQLQWNVDDSGMQRLVPKTADGHGEIVGTRWNWYVDLQAGLLGPARWDGPRSALEALAHMPVLKPEDHAEAMAALAAAGLADQVPAPKQYTFRNIEARVREARIELDVADYEPAHQRIDLGVYARVRFRYDDVVVAAGDRRTELRRRRGDVIEAVQRDPKLEADVFGFLRREQFEPLQQRTGAPVGSGSGSADTLPWVRRRRMDSNQAREWYLGLAQRAAALGYQLTTTNRFPLFAVDELPELELELAERGSDWFEARLGLEIDGTRVDLLPIVIAALEEPERLRSEGLIVTLPDGRRGRLARERLEPILALIEDLDLREATLGLPRERLPAVSIPPDWRFLPSPRAAEFLERLRSFSGLAPVSTPPEFKASLRDYQKTGVAWLQFLREFQLGGVLADDMGLGKTVQVLAHLAIERAAGRLDVPALVVCPTSVVPNWCAEAARFLPDLRVLALGRGDRRTALGELGQAELVVTSYALLRRDRAALEKQEFSVVVFDEAQSLKNRATQAYAAAAALRARQRLGLTGTPLENHLGELHAQFDLAFPGLLGSETAFNRRFRGPIEKQQNAAAIAELRRRIGPFLLRRNKKEVAAELPPRTRIERPIVFEDAQRDLYETLRAQMEQRVREALAERGLAKSHITVLDALLKLRQVCCDPRLVDLASARKVRSSAKLTALMDLLPTLIEEGRAVLLFSQFASMLDLIEAECKERALAYVRLDGSTADRATPVERFQAGEVPLFLISLKAGGTGLNLTRADTVILYDPWWNPAVEAQAIDRAHRIGQKRPVFVYELICSGTVEEKMQQLKGRKSDLAAAVLSTGEGALTALTADELIGLFDALPV